MPRFSNKEAAELYEDMKKAAKNGNEVAASGLRVHERVISDYQITSDLAPAPGASGTVHITVADQSDKGWDYEGNGLTIGVEGLCETMFGYALVLVATFWTIEGAKALLLDLQNAIAEAEGKEPFSA